MKSLIQKLTEAAGPSGHESKVREIIRAEIAPLAEEIYIDALGNLIARKGTLKTQQAQENRTKPGKRIMLTAHMDEIGLMVTHVDKNGFIRFTSIGVLHPPTLLGGRVRFLNGTPGIIGAEPSRDPTKTCTMDQLYIDTCTPSNKTCPIQIGDVATFESPFLDIGDRLVAKTMDDRIGCVVLIETLRALNVTNCEVYFVFTVQEEVGVRGVIPATNKVNPDLGISVEVVPSGDTPKSIQKEISLGKGPAVKIKDTRMIADPWVINWITHTAERFQIPYQREVFERGSNETKAIQVSRMGIPVSGLSIPCRYNHTASEMVDYQDVKSTIELLVTLLNSQVELP